MTRLFVFWSAHAPELAGLLAQHVLLVAASTVIAVAIGVPLGIFASRRPRLSAPIVGLANIVQTIPSLAMFGFLLPCRSFGGVGARAAIVVLILYGLLPIVRTTITGIAGIDTTVREAGVAMGMTSGELLRIVELPLALPSIAAAVRVAAVVASLGDRCRRDRRRRTRRVHLCGLSMVDSTVILPVRFPRAARARGGRGLLVGSSGSCRRGDGRRRAGRARPPPVLILLRPSLITPAAPSSRARAAPSSSARRTSPSR